MSEKSCQWWLNWYLLFFCHGGAEGQLQWVVKEKVTSYGQNLILLCPVENCCSEPAGWNVGLKAIILDVKTFSNDPKVKYHGTYNKDGFGVVIRNMSEADLNVTYRCVYGFDQSTPKYLLHDDVFRENQLQWVVKEKVTGYGQNLILFCPVENCCSEPAGWSVGPKWINLDVKTISNDPKVKYHGTYNKDGFGVVIRNLSEADLNVTYRCVYGFDQSTPKYLLYDDVFRENQLQWVVKEKVTGYGQNLILLCPVENCCSEPAGWSVGPKWINLDVKTISNDPKVKYHGTYNKDGFGFVIRSLSEADLNVTYRCAYGFDQSTPKYLLHGDVFREDVPDKDKEIDTAAIVVPIVVIMVGFIIGIMAYCVYKSRIKKKRQKQKGTDKDMKLLYHSDSQMENQPDKTNSLSKEENNFFRLYLLCQKIATQAVRQFFDSKVPGHTLEAFLKQYKPYLTSHRSVDRCTKDQEAKLFPDGQAVDVSTDFDFPLLYKLIRNLLTAMSDPTCGWGNPPSHGHVNETDDIEIVRKFRNMLSHTTEFAICDTDFSNHWTDLSQAIDRLSRGSLSTDVESMRMKTFNKCTENEMEELMRKDLKEIRKEFMEPRQDVTECKTYIADHRQEINNINTRHIPLNIQTKEAPDDLDLKDMMSCGRSGCIDGIVTDRVNEIDRQSEDQARLMTLPETLKSTEEMEDIKDIRATINYVINEIGPRR